MYYYSNNYSKYIEDLKLEKSKIAFQRLVEDSKEDKNPDIRIKEVPLSKESGSVTKEFDIPSKDGKPFYYEGASSEKSGNKIDTESLKVSEKSENRINPENEISNKSSEQIKDVSFFSNIEPNEVEYDTEYSLKNGSDINGENKLSSKGDSDISVESELNDKSGNEISIESETVSKSELDMFAENPLPSKNGADLKKQNELSSKNEKDLSGENVPSSKSVIDIIRSIKEEKKGEGKFADVVDNQKKKNNFVLEKSYQYFLMDPKDWEAIEYEKNAEKYKYYPADSYLQINATQKGAIEDITSVFGNSNNWSGAGAAILNTLKIATDLTDTIWPSVNIYKEGKTANKLRWDLRLHGENNAEVETGKKSEEEKIHGKSHANDSRINYFTDGEDLSEKEENDFSATVNVFTKGQHPENYEQTGDTQHHKDVHTENIANISEDKIKKDILESNEEGIYDVSVSSRENESPKVRGKNYENDNEYEFTRGEDLNSKDELFIHDGPANESGDLDTNFFEDSDVTDKDGKPYITGNVEVNGNQLGVDNFSILENKKEDAPKTFKYKDPKTNEDYLTDNIADASYGFTEQDRWYDRPNSIGKIYVMPPYQELKDSNSTEDYGGNIPFSIPLQNNLSFEQISRAATWNAIQFFGRIGDVQQYSKTGNLEAINLTTKYFVETDGSDGSVFTMSRLQDIEMMYRSLVLPASVSANYLYDESNGYYYFTRPPIINVVLGNPGFIDNGNVNLEDSEYIEHAELPYHNLFTDIYTTRSDNGELNNQIYYKNFVVTNVTIDKNLNDYNYYIGEKENGKEERHYYDTTGFTVTLTLLEIDENYLGSLPSFNNYNYTLQSRQAIQ